MDARYSIGTWDTDAQGFTPQIGVPSFNLTIHELRASMKELRALGYAVSRRRLPDGDHESGDNFTLVERTDGLSDAEILEQWKR